MGDWWNLVASPGYRHCPGQKECYWNPRALFRLENKLGGPGGRFLFPSPALIGKCLSTHSWRTQREMQGPTRQLFRAPLGQSQAMSRGGDASQMQQAGHCLQPHLEQELVCPALIACLQEAMFPPCCVQHYICSRCWTSMDIVGKKIRAAKQEIFVAYC